MRRARWMFAVALGACEPTLELTMTADPATASSTADLSCVRSVAVSAFSDPLLPVDQEITTACAGVAAPGIHTIADLPLHAPVSLPIPHDLFAIEVAGIDGAAGDCSGWPVFAAGTFYQGGDDVALLARPLLDCGDRVATPRQVRVIDFARFRADRSCVPPTTVTTMSVQAGVLADLGTYIELVPAGSEAPLAADGRLTLPTSYRGAVDGACVAAMVLDRGIAMTMGCVAPDQPSPCGGGDLVVPYASQATLQAGLDSSQLDGFGAAAVVAVVDTTGAPVAGATVSGFDAQDSALVYTEATAAGLTPSGRNATDASGTFVLYATTPTRVTVTANGRQRQAVLGGQPGAGAVPAIVVL